VGRAGWGGRALSLPSTLSMDRALPSGPPRRANGGEALRVGQAFQHTPCCLTVNPATRFFRCIYKGFNAFLWGKLGGKSYKTKAAHMCPYLGTFSTGVGENRRRAFVTPRTLIKCLNTGSQKVRKYRGMPSESVKHFRCVA
jgi:hypothetical protein